MGLFKTKNSKGLHVKSKFDHEFKNTSINLKMFHGIGKIENEASSVNDVINFLGEPGTDRIDDRGNRILEYPKTGIYFKFLNLFNEKEKQKVSFITIKKPYKPRDKNILCPGMKKEDVHRIMIGLEIEESYNFVEIWKNEEDKHMKFVYDSYNNIESIVIY